MRIPTATYRLQFCRDLTFRDADGLVDYLDDLGISDIYASPILTARPGSLHGYDIVDPSRVNPELGAEEELIALGRKLRERGMGLLLDTVPNHMCIAGAENAWWNDVLENGPSSPFARYFDIDWEPPKSDLVAKVLLPILGEQYGLVLENQEIQVRFETGSFFIEYAGNRLPAAPRTWTLILEPAVKALKRALGDRSENVLELESIVTALSHLPLRTETDRAKVRERRREKEIHPHVHALATRGGWDRGGTWLPVAYVDESAAERLFRHKVIKLLREASLLNEKRIEQLLSWRHTGFSVRGETHVAPTDRKALETIARYMLRCPVILSRFVWRKGGLMVAYKDQPDAPGEEIDACEYVARVLAHVPDPKRYLVHYYGAYSNAARGKRKKANSGLQPAQDGAPEELTAEQSARRRSWAELIRRVYEVDPLICSKCGGEMYVVSIITDPPVIDHILEHLAERDRTGRAPPAPAHAVA